MFLSSRGIVQYHEKFYGLANYKDCESLLSSNSMYPQQKIRLYIENFDNENLWINFSITPDSALT